ncbi:transposable element Tc3 transposase [Trichonephila clavipes]|nr:transposable element Tc3 transposase [Trichonephila clavipes]
MGAALLFMDDNARPHRANIVDEYLQSEDITRMDWPAYSPDLNPIEHVLDMLGRLIAARQPPTTCLPPLPQDQIDNLILSMPRRFQSSRIQSYSYFQPPRTPLVLHVVATPLKPPNQVQQHKAPSDSRYGMEESA